MKPSVSGYHFIAALRCGADNGGAEDAHLHDAVNRLLPDDISIVQFVEVDETFDARHSCIGKRYSYAFTLGEKRPLLLGRVAYLGIRDFDEQLFRDCLSLFIGKHNFQNFTNKRIDKDGFIRDIEFIEITCEDGIYKVELKSNGFMTYQIRFMIGAALKAGLKKITLEEVTAHLESSERAILPYKAPAEGLTLEEVYYGTDIFA